ncbi:IS110 family transposase [Arthrobacter sp. MDT3-24]
MGAVLLSAGIDPAVMFVKAKTARNIPGRKTNISDAVWLVQFAAHVLLRASFVPPEPIRKLRDLTLARAFAVQDRIREIHRLENCLEGSGITLSTIVSNLTGVSSGRCWRHWLPARGTLKWLHSPAANVSIADIGADMSAFPTPALLASWAGVCPGSNESAGNIKSTRTRAGTCRSPTRACICPCRSRRWSHQRRRTLFRPGRCPCQMCQADRRN